MNLAITITIPKTMKIKNTITITMAITITIRMTNVGNLRPGDNSVSQCDNNNTKNNDNEKDN